MYFKTFTNALPKCHQYPCFHLSCLPCYLISFNQPDGALSFKRHLVIIFRYFLLSNTTSSVCGRIVPTPLRCLCLLSPSATEGWAPDMLGRTVLNPAPRIPARPHCAHLRHASNWKASVLITHTKTCIWSTAGKSYSSAFPIVSHTDTVGRVPSSGSGALQASCTWALRWLM